MFWEVAVCLWSQGQHNALHITYKDLLIALRLTSVSDSIKDTKVTTMHSNILLAAAALFCVQTSSATCSHLRKSTQSISSTTPSITLETLNCTGQSSCSFTPKVYNITVAREVIITGVTDAVPSQDDSENIGDLAEANFDHQVLPSGSEANFSIGAATIQRVDTSNWNSEILTGKGGNVIRLYWIPKLAVENGTVGGCDNTTLDGVGIGISVPVKDQYGIVSAGYGTATTPISLGNKGGVSWGILSLSMVLLLIL